MPTYVDIEEKRKTFQTRVCAALGLNLANTREVSVRRDEMTVEWGVMVSTIDLNDYDWYYIESHSPIATVRLYIGRNFDNEAWAKVLEAEEEWLAVFNDAYRALGMTPPGTGRP